MSADTLVSRKPAGRGARLRWLDGWSVFTIGVAALVSVPVLVVLSHFFIPAGDVWRHLAETVLTRYIVNSLWLMIGVGTGTLVIGVATAWLVTMCRFRGRPTFEWALLLPMAVPAYVIAYTYTGLFEFAGPVQGYLRDSFALAKGDYWFPEIRSIGGAIAMMTLVLYPYVYLLSRIAFLEQSVSVLEVSRTLGCNPWRSFFSVALPLARPGIAAGVALALMETLNDFGTVQYFAVDNFTTGIFRTWFGMGEPEAATQLAATLMIFIFALVLIERLSRGRGRVRHTTSRYRALPSYQLTGAKSAAATTACFLPIFLGFLLPGAVLLDWTVETADRMIDARFFTYAANSFSLAAIASLLAVAIALAMVYGLRLSQQNKVMVFAARVASMGYAVPGAVIAVGVLLPFAWFDTVLNDWLQAGFDVSPGLVFSGTIFAVIFAYLVRFLAISLNTVEASLDKVTTSMDDASRTLGRKPGNTLLSVHLPMIYGSLLTAGILVFVDVMKELPATLFLRPFNFDTLAVRTYQLASDERLADASSSALAIVLVGVVPVVMLSIAIARSRPGHGKG